MDGEPPPPRVEDADLEAVSRRDGGAPPGAGPASQRPGSRDAAAGAFSYLFPGDAPPGTALDEALEAAPGWLEEGRRYRMSVVSFPGASFLASLCARQRRGPSRRAPATGPPAWRPPASCCAPPFPAVSLSSALPHSRTCVDLRRRPPTDS
jgi:hypothetical protein